MQCCQTQSQKYMVNKMSRGGSRGVGRGLEVLGQGVGVTRCWVEDVVVVFVAPFAVTFLRKRAFRSCPDHSTSRQTNNSVIHFNYDVYSGRRHFSWLRQT